MNLLIFIMISSQSNECIDTSIYSTGAAASKYVLHNIIEYVEYTKQVF